MAKEQIIRRAHDESIIWPKRLKVPGKRLNAQLVPLERTKRPLYVDRYGRGYSCHVLKNLIDVETGERVFMLRPINDSMKKCADPKRMPGTKNHYRQFRRYGNVLVHQAVLLAWVCPRPEGCQCDHLNGNNTDNRCCNLQWVTQSENIKRGYTLKRLRRLHEAHPELYKDPAKMTRKELLHLFSQE